MMRCRRGQNLVEFAVLIGVLAAALISMYMYAKRGLQAGIRGLADEMGPQTSKGGRADTVTESHSETTSGDSSTARVMSGDGGSQTVIVNEASTATGTAETVTETEL